MSTAVWIYTAIASIALGILCASDHVKSERGHQDVLASVGLGVLIGGAIFGLLALAVLST